MNIPKVKLIQELTTKPTGKPVPILEDIGYVTSKIKYDPHVFHPYEYSFGCAFEIKMFASNNAELTRHEETAKMLVIDAVYGEVSRSLLKLQHELYNRDISKALEICNNILEMIHPD